MPEYYRRVDRLMSILTPEEGEALTSMLIKLQNNRDIFK
jgi:hypothetical protein